MYQFTAPHIFDAVRKAVAVVSSQDKAEFTRLLEQVIAFDVDKAPSTRLANLVAQRRAKWLLGRTAELFAE